jgi:hypothetical protein
VIDFGQTALTLAPVIADAPGIRLEFIKQNAGLRNFNERRVVDFKAGRNIDVVQ